MSDVAVAIIVAGVFVSWSLDKIAESIEKRRRTEMKAPDKIYLGIQDLGSGYVYALSLDNNGEQEYIRKDTLLEWAKEMKEQVGLGLNAYDMGEENGKAEMLNALIDKLNSM